MGATLDWSHGLLCESERTLFRRLSIFYGGFTLGAAGDKTAACITLYTVVSEWYQKFADDASPVPLGSAVDWNGDGLPANRSSSRSATLCDGRWYLDAVLGRDLRDPSHVCMILEDGRPHLTVHRLLTDMLKEVLVQTTRRLG